MGPCVKRAEEQGRAAGPHRKMGKRGDITGPVMAIGIVTGRGKSDQVPSGPAFLHPRLCFTLLTSLGRGASIYQAHKMTHGWRLQDG